MKISYSNYPVLKMLEDGVAGQLVITPEDVEYFSSPDGEYFLNTFLEYKKEFRKVINGSGSNTFSSSLEVSNQPV